MLDLLVVGAGPAGRALTHRATRAGLSATLIDPAPQRPWTATYGAWVDDLPVWLPRGCVAAVGRGVVYTPARREVGRDYAILDTAALQETLSGGGAVGVDGVDVIADAAHEVGDTWVTLADGRRLEARVVIDARGNPRPHVADPSMRPSQTAYGVVVRRRSSDPDVGDMVIMDWRGDTGTFCYRVALDDDRVLLEETCLAGHPATTRDVLTERLITRLGTLDPGYSAVGQPISTEWVDFPLLPEAAGWRVRPGEPLRYGARGGMMNPASGYSVAESLRWADIVVDAIRAGEDPRDALWPWQARAVFRLRSAGLRALLTFDDDQLTQFFDMFFTLPDDAVRAYLSGRDDVRGIVTSMSGVFARVDRRMRRRLVRGVAGNVVSDLLGGLRRG